MRSSTNYGSGIRVMRGSYFGDNVMQKLGFGRQDVQDYVNARVVDDSEHVVLGRIMKGCGEARQAFDMQAAYGMTYTMDSVERLYAEMATRDRIDRQMREFIDRCGGVLSC